jgi:hypothetical protein
VFDQHHNDNDDANANGGVNGGVNDYDGGFL